MKGTITRLMSILTGLGAEPMAGPGERIPWDASYCQQFDPSGSPIEDGQLVEVEERGFFVKDSSGTRRLLKPALVRSTELRGGAR
jgi:hypothetical protein